MRSDEIEAIQARTKHVRAYKRVELALQPAPMPYLLERAACPKCSDNEAGVVGRLGLRLVFRCDKCDVRFHRSAHAGGRA